MKIRNLHIESLQDSTRVTASVVWENSDRPEQEIFIATSTEFADFLYPNPDAYLVGCMFPAIEHGERRLKLEEPVCPELLEGLDAAVEWFRKWYQPDWGSLQIEAKVRNEPLAHSAYRSAGSFLSGGVDSLALLRINHLAYPDTHPGFIKYCFLVYGFGTGGYRKDYAKQTDIFAGTVAGLENVAHDANVTLVPIYTNLRHLEESLRFWEYVFHGAFLGAVAHSLVPYVHTMSIASSAPIVNLLPWGSHPLIDPNFSSSELKIRHNDSTYTRSAKLKVVGQWDVALRNLGICVHPYSAMKTSPRVLNCGKCEKCLRTMVDLLVLGLLETCTVFPYKQVTKNMLNKLVIGTDGLELHWRGALRSLKSQGRRDLLRPIRKALFKYRIKRTIKRLCRFLFQPPWRSRWQRWRTRKKTCRDQ